MPAIPSEFFTPESIGTLTGATGLCFVVTNGIKRAFGTDPRWLGLLVAQIIAVGGVVLADGTLLQYVLAVLNGFLIFSTAAGAASMTAGGHAGEIGFADHPKKNRFLGSWF
jgi:hypothetical protein